jgi:hypothetical protein
VSDSSVCFRISIVIRGSFEEINGSLLLLLSFYRSLDARTELRLRGSYSEVDLCQTDSVSLTSFFSQRTPPLSFSDPAVSYLNGAVNLIES